MSAASPATATASAIASTRRGWDSGTPRACQARVASHSRASATRGWAPTAASRARARGSAGTSGAGPEKRTSAAKPAQTAQASANPMPTTSSAPKPRTIGTGDSSSTRKPTAVATPAVRIVGPPAAAAAAAAAARGSATRARCSSKRAWNWIE